MPRINIVDAGSGEILHQIPGADGVRPTTDPSCLVGFFDDHTIGWYDLPHDARIGTGVDPGFDIRDFLVIGARVLVWPFDGPLSEIDLDAGTIKPFGDPQAHVFWGNAAGPDRLLTIPTSGGVTRRHHGRGPGPDRRAVLPRSGRQQHERRHRRRSGRAFDAARPGHLETGRPRTPDGQGNSGRRRSERGRAQVDGARRRFRPASLRYKQQEPTR